jgi:hypothetical protein
LTDPEIVKLVDDFLNDHNYSEIATILNERGYKSGTGLQFVRKVVTGIRRSYDLRTRYARLRNTGKLTAKTSYMTLKVYTFIARLIRHILDKHFPMIRYAGLFSNRWRKQYLAQARIALNQPETDDVDRYKYSDFF